VDVQMGNAYHGEPTPAAQPAPSVRKPRSRKRPKGAPTHIRSWPLRPTPTQCREIRTRFFTGARVYNAVLGEFLGRGRAVKADPAWETARQLPHRSLAERQVRRAAFRSVEQAHGFTADAAQSFASSLRQSWVREHLPAQETQNLGARAFDAVRLWHVGRKGKPRFKWVRCGWRRSAAAQHTVMRVAELHRRLAEHRKTLHGCLANRLIARGTDIACERLGYVAWQKNFPRSVRDRAPGLLVEMLRRKAESAGGPQLYEYNPPTTALSQTCLCGAKKKKPLSQRVHRCGCGIREDRDLFSAYLGLHVRTEADGVDRLDLQAARQGWLHRQDVDESPKSSRSALKMFR